MLLMVILRVRPRQTQVQVSYVQIGRHRALAIHDLAEGRGAVQGTLAGCQVPLMHQAADAICANDGCV